MARSTRMSAAAHKIVSQGQFNDNHYEIKRDGSSTFLSVRLEENVKMILHTNLSNIVAKSANITIKYHPSPSLKDVFLFPDLIQSVITGPGELLLSAPVCGEIVPIQLNENTNWMIGANGLVAMTDDVHSRITSQTTMELNPTKNDRFFEVSGNGTLFVNSIGSIIRRELKKGEQWTVRPDHFVASNCRLIQQSIISAKSIYIFEGPGILILQSQSGATLSKWIEDHK